MNLELGTFLSDNGIKNATFSILEEDFIITEVEWIELTNSSLFERCKDYFYKNINNERRQLVKGEIIATFYPYFGVKVGPKSYIPIDYWLENKGAKIPVIKDIPHHALLDVTRKQCASLITICDFSARIKCFKDAYILEQYIDLKEGVEVMIRDPNSSNKSVTGIISKSEFVDFKFYFVLKPNYDSYDSYGEIRFGIESFIQIYFKKDKVRSNEDFISKQQNRLLTECQNSKEVSASAQNSTNKRFDQTPDQQPLDTNNYGLYRTSSPKAIPHTAPPTVGYTDRDMQFPQGTNHLQHQHYTHDNRPVTQEAESDAVPLNDFEQKQPESYGVVVNCLVKVSLMGKYHYGRVVWTGVFKQVPDHLWVLIETDKKQTVNKEEADGIKYRIKIGNVKPGHGLFVPAKSCEIILPEDVRCDKLPRSSLTGSPNEYDPCAATIISGGFVPPIKDLRKILGLKKGIQGLDNSCYMDASLFGMFCFNSRLDDIFLRESQETGEKNNRAERYTVVQKILKERIVYPLREEGFVRADQILLLRHKLDEAGVVDGLVDRERDPEEFLTCLLQHVLNVQPYLKIRGARNEDGFFFQIFTHRRPHINLPTVELLLEHAFREGELMLAEVPQFFLIQMPRDGKHFRLYPHIVPSLTLDISNITQSVYSPKCVLCSELAGMRCEECERSELYDPRKVFIHYCLKCSGLHSTQTNHEPKQLACLPKQQQGSSAQMKLFAVLTIEVAHYVCFAKCGANPQDWVMFDSMHDRIEEARSSRNVPNVIKLPEFEDWLSKPELLCKVSDRDAKKTVPDYIRRLTQDVYVCMYYSDMNEMF